MSGCSPLTLSRSRRRHDTQTLKAAGHSTVLLVGVVMTLSCHIRPCLGACQDPPSPADLLSLTHLLTRSLALSLCLSLARGLRACTPSPLRAQVCCLAFLVPCLCREHVPEYGPWIVGNVAGIFKLVPNLPSRAARAAGSSRSPQRACAYPPAAEAEQARNPFFVAGPVAVLSK